MSKSTQSVPNNPHPVLNEEKCNEYLSGLMRKRSSESELLAVEIIVGACTEKNTSHRKLLRGPQRNHKFSIVYVCVINISAMKYERYQFCFLLPKFYLYLLCQWIFVNITPPPKKNTSIHNLQNNPSLPYNVKQTHCFVVSG